jgi:hypothetical protein
MSPFAPAAFGFENGVLPILAVAALAVLLPMPFGRFIGLSQARLALIMAASALDLILASAALLAVLTLAEDPGAALDPLAFLERGPKFALAWGPVWALVWLVRAQGIERRKGLRMGREADDGLS